MVGSTLPACQPDLVSGARRLPRLVHFECRICPVAVLAQGIEPGLLALAGAAQLPAALVDVGEGTFPAGHFYLGGSEKRQARLRPTWIQDAAVYRPVAEGDAFGLHPGQCIGLGNAITCGACKLGEASIEAPLLALQQGAERIGESTGWVAHKGAPRILRKACSADCRVLPPCAWRMKSYKYSSIASARSSSGLVPAV